MMTIHAALTRLESRELSTVELVDSVLQRLEATEPKLHAWVEVYADEARVAAMAADEARARSAQVPALLGIPIGVKDIFDIAGRPTRCNSRLFADVPPATRNSDAVTALQRDGAIMLGKTVTQEFAAGVFSAPARNPWDPERIPGGSSGGSAAAVAAGSCLAALGSDTGGSIRIPASVTGTVGLKPTIGQIATGGVFPLSTSLDTVGPIARTVIDAMILSCSLRGRASRIPRTIDALARRPHLKRRRIGVLQGYFTERVQPGVAAAVDAAMATLRELGAELVPVTWEHAHVARAVALLISRIESAAVHARHLREKPELMGEDLRSRLEVGMLLSGTTYIDTLKAREALKHEIAALFRDNALDAVVAPSTPATAPKVDAGVVTFPDGAAEAFGTAMTRFTAPWNSTGQPVFSLPCGFDEAGLPVGLSFIGKPHDELVLAAIAHAYEAATPWHTRRPDV